MPDKRHSRVEEEVREILDRLEHEVPAPSRRHLRLVPPHRKRRPLHERAAAVLRRAPWLWIAGSLALALAAVVVSDSSETLAYLLAVASICVFFAPMVVARVGGPAGKSGSSTKTWRGRDITFEPPRRPLFGGRWRRRGPRL